MVNVDKLKPVNKNLYTYLDLTTKILFAFRYDTRGVSNNGNAWYLKAFYNGSEIHIATFSTRDDGRGSSRKDYLGTIWTDKLALSEANKMVDYFLDNCK